MALRQVKISDIDGAAGADVTVVIRDHTSIDQPKAIDVTKEQIDVIRAKAIKNAVTLEVRDETGQTGEVLVTRADLDKWLVKPDEVLGAARNLKGRIPGYSPTRNGT